MRQDGGRRQAVACRGRQRSLATKRPRRLGDLYLELVLNQKNELNLYNLDIIWYNSQATVYYALGEKPKRLLHLPFAWFIGGQFIMR